MKYDVTPIEQTKQVGVLKRFSRMKRLCPPSDSSASCEKKIKFSQSELQMLVEEEVQKAMQKIATKMHILDESIQQLQKDMGFEESIQKLEERIEKITRRAEKALTAIKSDKKTSLPSYDDDDEVITSMDCDDETESQKINMSRMKKERQENKNDGLDTTENIQKELNKSKQGLPPMLSALADLCKSCSPPIPESENESWYPPLPINPLPSNLSMEAVSYNIPQKVTVHLALIEHPAGLSVMWTGEEDELSLPPMQSYSVFLTMEKVKGSGIFPAWRLLGSVDAKSLPMWVSITKYKPGHELCVAVVGKDIYGRYGPYSDVVAAVLPE
ncbi:activating transcription factor 7-interacting protein 1 isoform X3 [Hippocampus comes]|uniref:activating transcription factor 7-interacting protein 1 isoform X3 n=1 Tax=Hippocampus comes TaxID=109280 RepID=UPI00094E12A0|nr:PREDICTED: activating transcription factor 7-interacting protein 2 isoform X3 [Hippocampus comes]